MLTSQRKFRTSPALVRQRAAPRGPILVASTQDCAGASHSAMDRNPCPVRHLQVETKSVTESGRSVPEAAWRPQRDSKPLC